MKKRDKISLKKNPLFLISIICLLFFLIILLDISTTKQIIKLDYSIHQNLSKIQTPFLTSIFIGITTFGNTIPIIIFTIILSLFLLVRRKYAHLILLIISMLIGLLAELFIKNLIHRARPENALIQITNFSFPSGHATMAAIFFTILLYSLIEHIKSKKTKLVLTIPTIIIIISIAFSRIYLEVHYFSDVLAGFILGILINSSMLLLIEFIYQKRKNG